MKTEFEYMNRMSEILQEVYEVNKDNIRVAAEKFAETMRSFAEQIAALGPNRRLADLRCRKDLGDLIPEEGGDGNAV